MFFTFYDKCVESHDIQIAYWDNISNQFNKLTHKKNTEQVFKQKPKCRHYK